MGKFIIKKRSNGEYQFNLLSENGEVVLTSEGYEHKSSCMFGINSVRGNSHLLSRYESHRAMNGQHYFVLNAANGQVIGTSELYKTEHAMNNGIESVMDNGRSEQVEDVMR